MDITALINQLHVEISTLTQNNVEKSIRAGDLLTEIKFRVGHGNWRVWVAENLSFSYRKAAPYMWFSNHQDELTGIKTMREAEELLSGTKKEKGLDAIGADYKRIRKELIRPVKLARRTLKTLSYIGDSPETLDQILAEMARRSRGISYGLAEGFVKLDQTFERTDPLLAVLRPEFLIDEQSGRATCMGKCGFKGADINQIAALCWKCSNTEAAQRLQKQAKTYGPRQLRVRK